MHWTIHGLMLAASLLPTATYGAERYSLAFSTEFHADVISGGKVGTHTKVGFIVEGNQVFLELTPFIEDLSFTKGKMTTLGTRQCRTTKGNSGNERYLKYEMCLRIVRRSEGEFEVTAEENSSSIQMPNSSGANNVTASHSETVSVVRSGGSCKIGLKSSSKSYRSSNPALSYKVTGGKLRGSAKCSVVSGNLGG